MELIPTNHHPKSRFDLLTEYGKSSTHLRMLGITPKKLRGIETLAELQALGKHQYHKVCRYLHPDTRKRNKGKPPVGRPVGQTFRTATKAYEWLMQLTEKDIVHLEVRAKLKWIRTEDNTRLVGCKVVLSGTIYDCPLPWHFERHMDYGYGYQQSFDHIAWQ